LLRSGAAGEIVQAAATFNYGVRRNLAYSDPTGQNSCRADLSRIWQCNAGDVAAVLDAELGLGTLAVSLRVLPDIILLDIRCTMMMLQLDLSSMSLTAVGRSGENLRCPCHRLKD
jgi:hypothetical protein